MPVPNGDLLVKKEIIEFDNCPLELGPDLTDAKAQRVWAFICSYHSGFVFSLQDLEGYKGKHVHIHVEDNHPIFKRPYRLCASERVGVQT